MFCFFTPKLQMYKLWTYIIHVPWIPYFFVELLSLSLNLTSCFYIQEDMIWVKLFNPHLVQNAIFLLPPSPLHHSIMVLCIKRKHAIVSEWRNPSRMGGCVGSPAGGRRGSASPSALSDSSLFPTTKNKPLKGERIRSSFDLQWQDLDYEN